MRNIIEDNLIETLNSGNLPSRQRLYDLLFNFDDHEFEPIRSLAIKKRKAFFDKKVYIRGLIEFTNYCKKDCLYCGIRFSKENLSRYRLSPSTILDCCNKGYTLGFRTFVLQGGEDSYFTDEKMCQIISSIKSTFPDVALTISIGEKSYSSYKKFFEAGADRFLLRHESYNPYHYQKIHPKGYKLSSRLRCLNNLKEIGYQTGCGFMVGSPYQKKEDIIEELFFIKEFSPAMVGIGPFIPAASTPFESCEAGSSKITLRLLSLLRIIKPNLLLPATTALGTNLEDGRLAGILYGANVLMPNLSPVENRQKYSLYNNKINTGLESAEGLEALKEKVSSIGYEIVNSRGDSPEYRKDK